MFHRGEAGDRPGQEPQAGPRWWEWTASGVGLMASAVLLFLILGYIPLRATDLWGHVGYGRWILEHRTLPAEDPVMPLAKGVSLVDTAWLSQVVLAATERSGGAEGLSMLFAGTMLATYLLLGRAFRLRGGRRSVAVLGVGLVIAVAWCRFATLRPESFGSLCLAGLLWLLAGEARSAGGGPRRATTWVGVPLILAAWTNLHGSFPVGVLLLGAYAVGRALEEAWRRRSPVAGATDPGTWRWLVLCGTGLAATLANPYGGQLLRSVVAFSRSPNLAAVTEWRPLATGEPCAGGFALSLMVLVLAVALSRRRLPLAHWILLAGLAAMTVERRRMVTWYAPVFAFVMAPYLGDLLDRFRARAGELGEGEERRDRRLFPAGASWHYTAVAALLLWIGFALSPAGHALLGGRPRPVQKVFGPMTPLKVAEHLRRAPPVGLVFNPQWWGDFLALEGPAGYQPMVTSHVHMLPPAVWRDYLAAAVTPEGWREVFARYGITTAVWDLARMPRQVQTMASASEWRLTYRDDQAAVFVRTAGLAPDALAAPSSGGGAP